MSQKSQNRNELEISKIERLTDEQLKDKVLDTNNAQLSKVANMSYYYFISESGNLVELIDDGFLNEIKSSQEKQRLAKAFDIIMKSFENLYIDMSKEEISEKTDELSNIRKELYNLFNAIHGYKNELSYIKELLDYQTMKVAGKEEYKYARVDKREINLLINRIGRTLDKNTIDDFSFIGIVSSILNIVPFRISRSKYFHVIKNTLIRNFDHYPINLVGSRMEEYKILFDSSLSGNYGIIFADYFTSIESLKNTNIGELTLDELDNTAREIVDLALNIDKIEMFINSLGLVVNRLIVLYRIKDKNIFQFKDENTFCSWIKCRKHMDKKRLMSLVESSNKKLIEMEGQLVDEVRYFEALNKEGIKREDFFDDILNEEMLFTKDVLTYYNDIEFTKDEVLFSENNEPIDNDYLEQLIDNLIQYINRSIVKMDNRERKIRMRRLLSSLELPFVNIEEFLSYVEYTLDERMVSKEEILFTIDALNYLLDELETNKIK